MLRIKDPKVSISFYTDASLSSVFRFSSHRLLLSLRFLQPDHRNGPYRKRADRLLRLTTGSHENLNSARI